MRIRPRLRDTTALLLLLVSACGRPNDSTESAPASAADPRPVAATPDTAMEARGDSGGIERGPAAPVDAAADRSRDSLGATAWMAGITEREGTDGTAVLQAVRHARHEGYDRVVFEFQERVPGYRIEYVDRPVRRCGSGEPVPLAGDGWLEVRFTPARAHTEAGEPTVGDRSRAPRLPVLRELELTCDFEGHVTWVLGLAAPNRYRTLELRDPARLVIDVRH